MNAINKFHNWRRRLRWNKQYKNGRWEKLKDTLESERYHAIIEFIRKYSNTDPSILDLGCGEGILCDRMHQTDYSYFLGLDFSSESIKNATRLTSDKSEFLCVDIHNFQPKNKFDVIIFNEVFYYFQKGEREQILNRMIDKLNENGIIITSIFRERVDCWIYFETKLKQLQFITVKTEVENMYWKIGVYSKR